MTMSIRASLVFFAAVAAGVTAAFSPPPAHNEVAASAKPAEPHDGKGVAEKSATAVNVPGAPTTSSHPVHWDYSGEGGPEHWGALAPENMPCASGGQQSPVDLANALVAKAPSPAWRWPAVGAGQVVNNGHTLQVNVAGPGKLELGGKDYALKQFHFHHPSEHTIDGKAFPLEVHFVHAAADGDLAVIGVLFEAGAVNPALNPIWAVAPAKEGTAEAAGEIDLTAFIPGNSDFFRYEGSLTTPPCSETVHWTVLSTPVTASPSQISAFSQLFPWNARPVQPLNRRFVLKTSG